MMSMKFIIILALLVKVTMILLKRLTIIRLMSIGYAEITGGLKIIHHFKKK